MNPTHILGLDISKAKFDVYLRPSAPADAPGRATVRVGVEAYLAAAAVAKGVEVGEQSSVALQRPQDFGQGVLTRA